MSREPASFVGSSKEVGEIALPRSMRSEKVRAERHAMLGLPHIAPLARYAANLRIRYGVEVPDFDPADGGTRARILFLKEKPGPMTSTSKSGRVGSGFISRDNDDSTAEATFHFMNAAGLPRGDTLMWNVVPGWNGTRKITTQELQEGVSEVLNLIALLPRLEVVVLVGKRAARAEPLLAGMGITVLHSLHPSPLVRASRPDDWADIPNVWKEAAATLSSGSNKTGEVVRALPRDTDNRSGKVGTSLNLADLTADVLRISDIYARDHGIDRSGDWALLKLQEELGELTAEHLRMSGRARGAADADKLGDEAADVLGMLLIYCDGAGIDLEQALQRKWLQWLEPR